MTEVIVNSGARLRAERERRGLSAQKAADELHLDGWVIDALEAEDYERVGPSVYAKGHLKRYAALLGLPTAEIMAGYESRSQIPKTPAPASAPANVRLRTDAPAVSNLPWPQIVGSLAALLLVLGVLWWKPWHQRGTAAITVAPSGATASAASATADTVADSPASAAVSADSSLAAVALPSSASPSAAGQASLPVATPPSAKAEGDALVGTGRARLRLSFSADSWVDIHDAAGRRAFAGKGRANTVRSVAGAAPMRVYLGFASGVQLEINNRTVAIGPQFVAGDVARFEAGADGVLRRDSHGAAAPAVQSRNARPTG